MTRTLRIRKDGGALKDLFFKTLYHWMIGYFGFSISSFQDLCTLFLSFC